MIEGGFSPKKEKMSTVLLTNEVNFETNIFLQKYLVLDFKNE